MIITRLKMMLGTAMLVLASQHALAADPIRFALCMDMTKSYPFITVPYVQGVRDYAALINSKGGIENHPVEIIIVEHGNEPQRGIECYERMKDQAITVDFLSTPVAKGVLPRAMKDGKVMIQAIAGRGDAVDGEVFEWVFPLGATYWGQAANIISHFKKQSGGSLKGKKIAFLHLDHPFSYEPLPVLQELQKREGFDLQLFPYPPPGSDQSSAWSQIRRLQPDLIVHSGFSQMNVVAAKEATRNGIPMDKIVTVSFLNDVDINNIGPGAAKGIRRSTIVASGTDQALVQEIGRELYDKGRGAGDRKLLSDVYYANGLGVYAPVFEAARLAIRNDKAPLTAEKMRRGLTSLRNYNANGLIPPLTVTAKDHGGGGKTRIEMWDGAKWVPQSEWFSDYDDLVWATVKTSSSEFVKSGK